jgi:hypothetical protein
MGAGRRTGKGANSCHIILLLRKEGRGCVVYSVHVLSKQGPEAADYGVRGEAASLSCLTG